MASIKAKLSSVELYTSQCGDDYSMILNIANDVLSRAEKLYIIVQEELEKISRQLNRVQRSYDDIQHKVTSYMQRMEDAAEEIDRCSEEISYIYSHPSTVTTTDDEGNETTEEVIDYDGIRAAERERDAARSTYNLYENKCDDARMVLREAGYTVSKFQNTKYGIEAVSRSIQNDIYEIKKYIRAIEDEAEFNIHSLQGVIDSLQSYLASKAIFMPEGSYYEEFAAAGIGKKSDSAPTDKQSGFSLFGKKESKTSTSDNKSNTKIKDIYGIKATEFREDRVETMSVAFDNAPSWIVKQIESVGSKTKIKEKKKTEAYYSPSRKEIVMTKEYTNDVYQEVFKHEFGHYVDHANGWLSEQTEFKKAFEETCKRLDLSDFKGADNSMKLFTAVRKSDIAKFDHHLQDIFSSIYVNDYLVVNTFMSEGCEFYHHENDYWATDHNRENEIFADLFAIYSSGDKETISFVENNFSELSTTFKKILGA